MSLLTSASLWQNDDNQKKRISTMKKPDKFASYNDAEENMNTLSQTSPSTIDDVHKLNETKNNRVSELLNKMTSVQVENDGNKLSNFVPISNPEITNKDESSNPNRFNAPNRFLPQLNSTEYEKPSFNSNFPSQNFASKDSNLADLSNYRNVYQPPQPIKKPYYSNMGIHTDTDNKLLEKINYMIHLLEEQQSERTNNITEEFVLYTFFGVFIIYVLDSFARTGKYIR